MKPISRDNAEHYTWSSATGPDLCDGWHLHSSAVLSVIEERMPPETAEQRHFHQCATQFFYVLAGELNLEIDGETATLTHGNGCTVPSGTWHQVFNRGKEDVRFLVISQPPAQGDRIAVPHAG